jgi:hypothetical protein
MALCLDFSPDRTPESTIKRAVFAHGFQTLSDDAEVRYHISERGEPDLSPKRAPATSMAPHETGGS